jgi:hypothetical protein
MKTLNFKDTNETEISINYDSNGDILVAIQGDEKRDLTHWKASLFLNKRQALIFAHALLDFCEAGDE